MDVTGSILQVNTPDGKMEAYQAQPPAGSQKHRRKTPGKRPKHFSPNI